MTVLHGVILDIQRFLTLQRGAGGRASTEPKRVGATLKNFFAENSPQTPKSKIYTFLTSMHHNVGD